MDVDLVYMWSTKFAQHSVHGDWHIQAVVGLDWIGSFQATIPLLYWEQFRTNMGSLNSVECQFGSGDVSHVQFKWSNEVCHSLSYFQGTQNEYLFTMSENLLLECTDAHGIRCMSDVIFVCSMLISHIVFSCDTSRKGLLCAELCCDHSCNEEQLLWVLSQCVAVSKVQLPHLIFDFWVMQSVSILNHWHDFFFLNHICVLLECNTLCRTVQCLGMKGGPCAPTASLVL